MTSLDRELRRKNVSTGMLVVLNITLSADINE